ncbi:SRPBCC domain-containing protein [Arthrobacter sp. H20]|uniref:SRPBCC domain-containing protein n=1 Tax=Arthrobacter sp. H20 TaxID=1267981 RepID=UPI00047D50F0|nr:SRPBCC domain-containing protein [Arthrobacter sp. H20]
MTDLFSDASPPQPAPDRLAALEFGITVPVPPEHAAAGFSEHIHLWWPAGELSVWGSESFFDLENRALVETSTDDEEAVWAEVSRADDGRRLEMIWRHQPDGGVPTEVTIVFHDDADSGSRVSLVHGGWTAEASSREDRAIYEAFWPLALEKFCRFMGGTP